MNIASVPYRNNYAMKADPKKQEAAKSKEAKKDDLNNEALLQLSPAKAGLINGLLWGGIGFAFDRSLSLMFKAGTSLKTSACVNGTIAVASGLYTYYKVNKMHKNAAAQKTDNAQNA